MSSPTRHCYQCGLEYSMKGNPGRSETCDRCRADWRVCRNCVFHDRTVAYECRERRADPVPDKTLATYCEFFDFARRVFVPKDEVNRREAQTRLDLKKLLGD